MAGESTTQDVAEWMLSKLDKQPLLYQEVVVYEIERRFGAEFTYINNNGNIAITRGVLDAFRRLTGDDVVWVLSDRYWRRRQPGDEPGRQQSY